MRCFVSAVNLSHASDVGDCNEREKRKSIEIEKQFSQRWRLENIFLLPFQADLWFSLTRREDNLCVIRFEQLLIN